MIVHKNEHVEIAIVENWIMVKESNFQYRFKIGDLAKMMSELLSKEKEKEDEDDWSYYLEETSPEL